MQEVLKTKRCHGCNLILDSSFFNKNRKEYDKLQSLCKQCSAAYSKKYYQDNKAGHIVAVQQSREDLQLKILHYLLQHPCVDCGEKDPVVLEFDHVRGTKDQSIANLVNRKLSWRLVSEEIQKCDVRCANCHRRKTAKESNTFRWRQQEE